MFQEQQGGREAGPREEGGQEATGSQEQTEEGHAG